MNPFNEGLWNNRGIHSIGSTGEVLIIGFSSQFLIVECSTAPDNPTYIRGGYLIASFNSSLGLVENNSYSLVLRVKKFIILPSFLPTPYDILIVSAGHLSNLSVNIWEHSSVIGQ